MLDLLFLNRHLRHAWRVLCAASVLFTVPPAAAEGLAADQMAAWSRRFESEIWPLMTRHERDGCVGCHTPRHRSMLKFSGRADADFRMLLEGGFLLPQDPGALLHVVTTPNPKTRMPPDDRPSWSGDEVALLKRFVTELHTLLSSL